MNLNQLRKWQWEGYATYHQHRGNLWLHIVAIPLFLAGFVVLLAGAIRLAPLAALAGAAAMLVSVILQGRGHKMEAEPPVPFSSPQNGVARIFIEQWINFPRFLFSGGWRRALGNSATVAPENPRTDIADGV